MLQPRRQLAGGRVAVEVVIDVDPQGLRLCLAKHLWRRHHEHLFESLCNDRGLMRALGLRSLTLQGLRRAFITFSFISRHLNSDLIYCILKMLFML